MDSKPPNADQSEKKYSVDTKNSVIKWTGGVLGVKYHTGTLKITRGDIILTGDRISGGGIIVDMESMSTSDSNYDAEHTSDGLIGHLSSPDFFDVKKFKTANLIFSPDGSAVMTVKGKTKKISYSDLQIHETKGGLKLTAKSEFNRQDFGVTFKTGEAIAHDIVKLEVELMVR